MKEIFLTSRSEVVIIHGQIIQSQVPSPENWIER